MELRAQDLREATSARRSLQRHLERWQCERSDDGLLVFAELVTNAVKHGGGAARIDVVHGASTLRFEIHDHNPAALRPRPVGDASGGFGLRIVDQVAERWGWEPTADGKVVWCDVPCCPD